MWGSEAANGGRGGRGSQRGELAVWPASFGFSELSPCPPCPHSGNQGSPGCGGSTCPWSPHCYPSPAARLSPPGPDGAAARLVSRPGPSCSLPSGAQFQSGRSWPWPCPGPHPPCPSCRTGELRGCRGTTGPHAVLGSPCRFSAHPPFPGPPFYPRGVTLTWPADGPAVLALPLEGATSRAGGSWSPSLAHPPGPRPPTPTRAPGLKSPLG